MSDICKLFYEIVSMMGMRGYDISAFSHLIQAKMFKERMMQLGNQVEEDNKLNLLKFIIEYRYNNFNIPPNMFGSGRMGFSMVFKNLFTGMTTLVLISDDEFSLTSKEKLTIYIQSYLNEITSIKTSGFSRDSFVDSNRISVIFILNEGISSYSRTFIDELSNIEIFTENQILNRCYDNCMQSHIRTIPKDEKNILLSTVGLNSNNIPSVTKKNDILCKILNLNKSHLMIATRRNISSEEIVTNAVFLRDIK